MSDLVSRGDVLALIGTVAQNFRDISPLNEGSCATSAAFLEGLCNRIRALPAARATTKDTEG